MGSRGWMDKALLGKLLKAGYAVVSIDYRLAPETKLPAILEDLQDACKWVREKGPELFHINPTKIAVMGGSAGGYLTLAAGFRVDPRPTALVSLWAINGFRETVRTAAARALGRIAPDDPKAIAGLVLARDDSESGVRQAASESLLTAP
jgi:acetyl esterase/lipase